MAKQKGAAKTTRSKPAKKKIRISEGAMALIHRKDEQAWWMAQWNEKWEAFNFVGGHRENGETFYEAVVREVEEELELKAGKDFTVSPEPVSHLEYRAFSRSADVETAYTMELFEVQLRPAAERRALKNPENRWISEQEILAGQCEDGKAVSETMLTLLSKAKLLQTKARRRRKPRAPQEKE